MPLLPQLATAMALLPQLATAIALLPQLATAERRCIIAHKIPVTARHAVRSLSLCLAPPWRDWAVLNSDWAVLNRDCRTPVVGHIAFAPVV
jgi:hypothetical protein